MAEPDHYNAYTSTGEILQLRYAEKAAAAGSTILGMRNSKGAVLLVARPILSKLHVQESNRRIHKLSSNSCIVYTGVLSDGIYPIASCKRTIQDYKQIFENEVTAHAITETLRKCMHSTTSYLGLRPLGVDFITAINDKGVYKIYVIKCGGEVLEYSAYAAGIGSRRAVTELEKHDFESMEVSDLIDYGVKLLYTCYDPLSEPEFTVEASMISDDSDGKFVIISDELLNDSVEKYRHLTVDGDQ